MATYVLLTKMTPEVTQDLRNREKIGKQWLKRVSEKCPEVKWVAHYALLGRYDFMDIYEAPNEEVAAKVSLITLSTGAFQTESWAALPYGRFLEIADEIE